MILFDMSNIVFSTALDYNNKTGEEITMSLLRHLIINKLIAERKRLKDYDDEVVLCFDSRHYWRKDVFPYYKASRRDDRESSKFDWDTFFKHYDQLKQELREYFPVKCVEVHGAEADDIMAILAARFGNDTNVVIVSADNDLVQIQETICPKVKQWSPYTRKWLKPGKNYSLFEHVLRGDRGDGIPNILSDDDCIVKGVRQKAMKTKDLESWRKYGLMEPENFCKDAAMLDRFVRNRTLIDLRKIPTQLATDIVKAYEEAKPATGKMFGYLTANRLTRILADGGW